MVLQHGRFIKKKKEYHLTRYTNSSQIKGPCNSKHSCYNKI